MRAPRALSPADQRRLRAWLEYIAETAIDMLDQMDAADEDRDDDEIEHAEHAA